MNTLLPNTLLQGGKYKIVRHISSGGFGNTYEGVHTMMDTRVAIKEFFPKMFCNRDENTSHVTVATQGNRELVDKLRKKFNEEAKAVYNMSHPNIVKVYDTFEENGTAYYVMEYIDGKSLNEITKERGKLSETEAVGYIRQVANALKYVHSLNRLHLDIKPGNIMVDKIGKAILIDFGASKHYDDKSGENTSTLMGVNTKGYAPIEQSTQSFTSFSPATDIYALGATLYKLLTGVVPPDANLLLAEEEKLKPLANTISSSTRNAVMHAMKLRRKDRPQSVDEFLAYLYSIGAGPQNTASSRLKDVENTLVQANIHQREKESQKEEVRTIKRETRKKKKEEPCHSENGSNNWGFWVILIVAIVAIGIYMSHSESKTDGIQTPISEPTYNSNSSKATQNISFSYDQYYNERFGYSVKYPNNMKEGTRSQNGDGARFRSPEGEADFTVYGYYNNSCLNSGTIENEYNDIVADYGRSITYKVLKSNYFVVSGINSGKVFYHVTKWKGDIGVTAIIEYEEEYKDSYNKACNNILNSLTIH